MRAGCLFVLLFAVLWGCEPYDDGASKEGFEDVDTVCDVSFSVRTVSSPVISTVGIVEWVTSMPRIDSAFIEFGKDTRYGLFAPVDLDTENYRTLLIGMQQRSTYHYRIVAKYDQKVCRSADHIITTEGQPTALGPVYVTVNDAVGAPHGGYTVSSMIRAPYAFILDAEGEYVWWYNAPISTISRARMSADGKHMLIGNLNLKNNGIGAIVKVTMDGLQKEMIRLPDRHHDFTVLPDDGTIAYIEYEQDGLGTCDRLVERGPDGETKIIYTIREDFGHRATDGEWCHTNAVNYDPGEDTYYLSILKLNAILKIDRTQGELLWVLGGQDSTFDGPSWSHQHQHQLLDNGNILLFSNGEGGFDDANHSLALEYALNGTEAIEAWRYDGGVGSSSLGDVQRLGNGNTLVTYSNAGIIHEVDTDAGTLLLSFVWPNDIVGYTIRRDSLYGPPQDYL